MKTALLSRKSICGLAVATTLPAAFAISACTEDVAPRGEEEETGSAEGAYTYCVQRTKPNSPGWGWQYYEYQRDGVCSHCNYSCANAPSCGPSTSGKTMWCVNPTSRNDLYVYRCAKGATSGPKQMICGIPGGSAAGGNDHFPDPFGRSW